MTYFGIEGKIDISVTKKRIMTINVITILAHHKSNLG